MGREVAFIAYHFHWTKEEIMLMSHLERHRWVDEISHINREINDLAKEKAGRL